MRDRLEGEYVLDTLERPPPRSGLGERTMASI